MGGLFYSALFAYGTEITCKSSLTGSYRGTR